MTGTASKALLDALVAWLGPTGIKSGAAVLDRLVVAGMNFLTLVVVARVAGAEALGTFALAWTIVLLSNVLHEAFVTSPYTVHRERHRSMGARRLHAGGVLLLHAGLSLLLAAFAIAAAGMLDARGAALAEAAWALAVVLPASALREFARKMLFARLAAWDALRLDACVAALQAIGLLVLWQQEALGPASALCVVAVATGGPAVAWLVRFVPSVALPRWRGLVRRTHEHMRFARWLAASQASDLAMTHGIAWLVAAVAGVAAAGIFAAANSIVMVANPIVMGIGSILLPRIARAQHERGTDEVARIVWKVTLRMVAAIGALTLVLALFGGPLVAVLYAIAATGEIALVVALLAFSSLLSAAALPVDNGLMVVDRQDANLAASLAGLAAATVGAVLLLPSFGLAGAALAMVGGAGVNTAWQAVAFRRETVRRPVVRTVRAARA